MLDGVWLRLTVVSLWMWVQSRVRRLSFSVDHYRRTFLPVACPCLCCCCWVWLISGYFLYFRCLPFTQGGVGYGYPMLNEG